MEKDKFDYFRMRLAKKEKMILSPGQFTEINLLEQEHPNWMTRAYQNNRYVVMIQDNCETTHGKCIKTLIQKHDNKPIMNHWKELQNIKNKIFGEETLAIEYYPEQSKLIDESNIYWIFIYPEGIIPVLIENNENER